MPAPSRSPTPRKSIPTLFSGVALCLTIIGIPLGAGSPCSPPANSTRSTAKLPPRRARPVTGVPPIDVSLAAGTDYFCDDSGVDSVGL